MIHRPKIVIRCDAGRKVGFGHVVRCLALANRLSADAPVEALFAMQRDEIGNQFVRDHGFFVEELDFEGATDQSEDDWLENFLMNNEEVVCLVLDVRTPLTKSALMRVRRKGLLVITVDDLSARSSAVDQVYLPPIPQVKRMNWEGFAGERFIGWDWILMPERVMTYRANIDLHREPKALRLVC